MCDARKILLILLIEIEVGATYMVFIIKRQHPTWGSILIILMIGEMSRKTIIT